MYMHLSHCLITSRNQKQCNSSKEAQLIISLGTTQKVDLDSHKDICGGCATTVGYNEYTTVKNYIKNQAQHHAIA
jgi:REP element-mobilizing transposase RayT